MKKIIFILLFIGVIHCNYAQNENTKWYFGAYAALDFMTNPPTVLNNSAMYSDEGCASIADAAGNLLFYTNGVIVWNKQHVIMANGTGLFGNNTTTQSSIIAKKPGSVNLYYIFTLAASGDTTGLNYSIVDMSLAAGMGSVTVKNVPIYASPCGEKLHATKHANNTDYWVIIHELNSNNFRTYLLNSTGVNATAVISSAGNTYTAYPSFIGSMKISPTGKNLGMATANGAIELYNFNKSAGTVSNPLTLITNSVNFFYGCEFSSDGTKFYAGSNPGYGVSNNSIIQWDLSSGINASIVSSSVVLSFGATITTNTFIGSMQLASNGKIYITQFPSSSISLVNNPNKGGTACNFVYNSSGANTYTWSTLQTGSSITVTPATNVVYTVFGTDGYGCENSNQILISVSPCTGIDELKTVNEILKIYPNPVNEILNIEFEHASAEIKIFDMLGNELKNEELKMRNGKAEINMSELKSGIYFIKVGNVTRKFVKN